MQTNDRRVFHRVFHSILLPLALAGCDRSGEDKVPQPNPNFDAVVELGQLEVITADQLGGVPSTGGHDWCEDSASLPRETVGDRAQDPDVPLCHYGQVGLTEIGTNGGASFTFKGTGGDVCLIVDPETVFWSATISEQPGARVNYSYPDVEEDDGDLDLFAGLSAYYTGSPGVEIGDFKGFYTDSLGNEIAIEYGLCRQAGHPQGTAGNQAHSGRATPEFCTIDTANLADIEFTVVMETFSVPIDDGVLSFAVVVVDGSCAGITECTLQGESLDEDYGTRSCSTQLESAFCGENTLLPFCCLHPEMCGEDADIDACDAAFDMYEDVNTLDELREEYCPASGLCCDSE